MVKKTGLGKGLDALFGDSNIMEDMKKEEKQDGEVVENIKVIEIEPNRKQPRKNFDEEAIEELADSIKIYGVIQPIIVTKKEDYYEIVAGERRWRAAKKAGLSEMPCIVRNFDERKNREIALIENIQREDLNPIEKAMGIKNLITTYGLKQEEIAKRLGKSRSAIANTVRLLNLEPRVLELAKQGKLTEGHCRALLSITDPEKQYKTAVRMIERNATVRQVENLASKKVPREQSEKNQILYRDIENRFQSFFGTKVRLDVGKRRGKIIIEYANNDDLERILELMK